MLPAPSLDASAPSQPKPDADLHTRQEALDVEHVRGPVHQFHFHFELLDLEREHLGQLRIVDALDELEGAVGLFLPD